MLLLSEVGSIRSYNLLGVYSASGALDTHLLLVSVITLEGRYEQFHFTDEERIKEVMEHIQRKPLPSSRTGI